MHLPKLPRINLRIPTRDELLHRSYKGGHTAYFALVYLEGHGLYAVTGGALFLLAVLDWFLHFE